MSFEEYWVEVEELRALPNTAIEQLPSSLSTETKRKLMKLRAVETVEIIKSAIDIINHGSVESVDDLVKNKLNHMR